MGKLLRVLVVLLLLLSIGALVFGMMLFGKRELLIGRTQKLEKALIQVGTLVEAEAPKVDKQPDYPARDVSPNTEDFLDNPQLSTFWDAYSNALEVTDLATLNLNEQKVQLMQYYKIDPVTGKVQKDAMGNKMMSGEGTMQTVLDDLLAKAETQFNRLNETRQQLSSLRSEYVASVEDLNQTKRDYRKILKKVADLEAQVARLQGEVRDLKEDNAALEEDKRNLEDKVAEQSREIELLEETKVELDDMITQLKKELDERQLVTQQPGPRTQVATVDQGGAPLVVDPGVKGTVVATDNTWNFAVLALSDATMRELLGEDLSGPVPGVELMIRRSDDASKFVTKVRVQQIKRDRNLAIADVLSDWQQMDVQEGDVVFY